MNRAPGPHPKWFPNWKPLANQQVSSAGGAELVPAPTDLRTAGWFLLPVRKCPVLLEMLSGVPPGLQLHFWKGRSLPCVLCHISPGWMVWIPGPGGHHIAEKEIHPFWEVWSSCTRCSDTYSSCLWIPVGTSFLARQRKCSGV